MRVRSRLFLGCCGLAMSATTAWAQVGGPSAAPPAINLQHSPEMQQAAAGVMPPGLAGMPPTMAGPLTGAHDNPGPAGAPVAAPAAHQHQAEHHHHGILGRRHCVECQRAHAKAADGVDVPPPPGYPGGITLAPGETLVSGPVVVSERVIGSSDPNAPGYAVVGGPEGMPGHATTGGMPGSEPAPIGVATAGHRGPVDPRMAAAMPRPGAGSYDPSVMPTSVPAPPTPMSGPGHNRPHVVGHLLGLPKVGRHYEAYQDKKRQQHAAISYDNPNEKVTELPASMVYGRR